MMPYDLHVADLSHLRSTSFTTKIFPPNPSVCIEEEQFTSVHPLFFSLPSAISTYRHLSLVLICFLIHVVVLFLVDAL